MAVEAASEHAVDQSDVDRLCLQGAPAGFVDRVGAVPADQVEQPVDLPHFGPRQRMFQAGGDIAGDVLGVRGSATRRGPEWRSDPMNCLT
ncbi:hypothetical protein [Amycolatopsis sp. A1MSW2902]|uniref:hypothetical protein n=1 Tax=Amycolatopsis sp. A1MSW2902 TaxID=687413 RepID=UPI00307EC281